MALQAVTRRGGEITRDDLKRRWPHHVALPPGWPVPHAPRGDILRGCVLSASPLTYFMRRNDRDRVAFCFSKPGDAEAFAKHFGGQLLGR
jgi:hypothetical protein